LQFKVLFMIKQSSPLDALQDIRSMMQRSSRFISLSGLSGIAAGVWGLAGACVARVKLSTYYSHYNRNGYSDRDFTTLKQELFVVAAVVMALALLTAFYFTWRRAARDGQTLWDRSAKLLMINTAIPLVTGGLFVLVMLQYSAWMFIAPACLIFYGLALVNGSKYTLSDIRYLGLLEIVLGLINTQYTGYGLYFWAAGFGLLHIIYGFVMWWKNERTVLPSEVDKEATQ
jgi:hypothetical protein